jgi:hypothetical protein
MARDGSGTYTLPAGNPVVTGTTVSSTWANNTFTDVASALTQSLSKDGQTTMTGNQPMAGNKHTGVGNATALCGATISYLAGMERPWGLLRGAATVLLIGNLGVPATWGVLWLMRHGYLSF